MIDSRFTFAGPTGVSSVVSLRVGAWKVLVRLLGLPSFDTDGLVARMGYAPLGSSSKLSSTVFFLED